MVAAVALPLPAAACVWSMGVEFSVIHSAGFLLHYLHSLAPTNAKVRFVCLNYRVAFWKNRTITEFLLFQEMKVNWATSPGNQPKQDTSSKYHLFFFLHSNFSATA
jgi:hypothetical protein